MLAGTSPLPEAAVRKSPLKIALSALEKSPNGIVSSYTLNNGVDERLSLRPNDETLLTPSGKNIACVCPVAPMAPNTEVT